MKEVCHTKVLVEANARVQSDDQVGNLEEGTGSSRQLDPRTINTCFFYLAGNDEQVGPSITEGLISKSTLTTTSTVFFFKDCSESASPTLSKANRDADVELLVESVVHTRVGWWHRCHQVFAVDAKQHRACCNDKFHLLSAEFLVRSRQFFVRTKLSTCKSLAQGALLGGHLAGTTSAVLVFGALARVASFLMGGGRH